MNHSEMQTFSRYDNYLEKPKWTPKNEFFIFEAETFFVNDLNYPNFPVIKRKNESEVKMIKF